MARQDASEEPGDGRQILASLEPPDGSLGLLARADVIGIVAGEGEHVLEANRAFCDMLGIDPADVAGGGVRWTEITPPEWAEADREAVRQVLATGRVEPFEKEYLHSSGRRVPVLLGGVALTRDPFRWVFFVADLTERKRIEVELRAAHGALSASNRRLRLLLDVGDRLSATLDLDGRLRALAQAVVPELADWAIVHLVGDDGELRPVAVAHMDPAAADLLRDFTATSSLHSTDAAVLGRVAVLGEPLVLDDVTDELLRSVARSDEHLAVLRAIGCRSLALLPLQTGDRTFGMLTLGNGGTRRVSVADLELGVEIGARAAQLVDHALVFQRERAVAETLQRSLLPAAVPVIPGLDLAVAYWPALSPQVGGDFYDVFRLAEDRWGLVIGDVCGKGVDAAALTGIARHTLRAAASHTDDIAEPLRWVDEAVAAHGGTTFCTLCYGALSREPAGAFRYRFARGGHPPPLVVRPDGSWEAPGAPGTLLGVSVPLRFSVEEVPLGPGDVLVLYTDGLTDAPRGGGVTAERMAAAVAAGGAASAATVVARLRALGDEAFPGGPPDDIALVVARVVPAGPDGAAG